MGVNEKIAGDSIDLFTGEFLTSPIPLQLSLNYCSHKCAYCFANLNRPGRWADVKKTMRLLMDYQNRTTLEATLLQQGYPVLISNKVDPFAATNHKQALPIMAAMTEMGIPIAIQTKGGFGIAEALQWLPASCWYISLSFIDDGLRKKIEPGAPSIQSRFELIERLVNKGHQVVIGLNPCVPEWLPDPVLLLEEVKKRGASGVWIEHLHLNKDQSANLSKSERLAMGDDVIEKANYKKVAGYVYDFLRYTEQCALEIGLEVFTMQQSRRSEFFRPYREVYKKTFPVLQDFINACYQDGKTEKLRRFEEFSDLLLPMLPIGQFGLKTYIGVNSAGIYKNESLPNQMTFPQLLAVIWKDHRMKASPSRVKCFALAAEKEDNKWVEWRDNRDLPYYFFDPDGFSDSLYCEAEEE